MSTWMALFFALKPGHEDAVEELFKNSGRPEHVVKDDDGNQVGMLLRTLVFVGQGKACRVIEIDGDIMAVSKHMSQQDEVVELEAQLEEHLAEPRDMTSPQGAMEFFMKAGMRCVIDRAAGS